MGTFYYYIFYAKNYKKVHKRNGIAKWKWTKINVQFSKGSRVPTLQEQEFHNIEDLSLEQLKEVAPRNIVGCDPGKRSLVYMMDDKGNKLQYTAPQRKRETKAKTNQRILLVEKKRNNIIEK